VWSAATAGSGTASGAGLVAGAGLVRQPGLVGQLVQVPGGWCSARQLLRSKAETEVLKCLATAQSGSNPKGSGTKMTRGWDSGHGDRQLQVP
jgi:hypothetical protein